MSRAPVWTCKSCAERHGIGWPVGGSSADGGWCGVGRHAVPRGERIEYLADGGPPAIAEAVVLPAAQGVAIAMPVDDNGQLGLL